MDGVFLGLAELLLGISLGLCPREIPQSSPASPWKTPSIPPLLLGLTQPLALPWSAKKYLNTARLQTGQCPNCYTIIYYTTLNYTTLQYTTLHYTTLQYTKLHYTTLHYTTLHYTTLHYTTLLLLLVIHFHQFLTCPIIILPLGQPASL